MTSSSEVAARPDWLPRDVYPFTLRSLELPSGTVTYVDEGGGPTLLFVHAGMWSFIFRDVIERLREDFRCIALDFPGYGLAPDADEVDGFSGLATILDEFVETLDLTDLTLILHDLGGPVGIGFATARPHRVRAFVLTQTFAWEPKRRALRTMLRVVGSAPVAAFNVATNLIPMLTATSFGVGKNLDKAARRGFLGPFRDRRRRRRFHYLMQSASRSANYWQSVESAVQTMLNDRPVLTIFGEKNDPFGFQERLGDIFPKHHDVVVAGGNHFPMMDDPDLFADSVRTWWQRVVRPLVGLQSRVSPGNHCA